MAGLVCCHHPDVQAEVRCTRCQNPICATCVFTFPGDLRVCPDCVADPGGPVSPRRQRLGVIGLVLAVATVISFALSVASAAQQHGGLSGAFSLAAFGLTIAGVATSMSAMDRRAGNSWVIWTGVVLNLLLGALWLFVIAIGMINGDK